MDTPVETSQLANIPIMSRKKFADLVGVTEDTVTGWIQKGYIPVIDIGKYRVINLALVSKYALEQVFRFDE